MKHKFSFLLTFAFFIGMIFIILISRVFTHNSTLSPVVTFNPLHLIIINLAIFLFGIVLIMFASKIGIWWYQTYYNAIDELNRRASVTWGFKVEEVFAQEAIIRKFTGPNTVIWMLRIIGLVISGISAYNIFDIIIHIV